MRLMQGFQLSTLGETCRKSMRPIIRFFVGDEVEYKRQYHEIVANPKKHATLKYRLPWPLHAYKGMKHNSLPDLKEPLKNVTTWPQTLTMTEECKRCKKEKCKITIPIGIAMLLAVGAFRPQEWNEYCSQRESMGKKTEYDYSHLHGLNWCINSLNGDWDMRWVNLGPRKQCHGKAFTTKKNFCKIHEKKPCYLRGARMVLNSQKIAREMIELHAKKRPGIAAYEYHPCG